MLTIELLKQALKKGLKRILALIIEKTPTPVSVWKPLLRNSIVIFILQVPLKFAL